MERNERKRREDRKERSLEKFLEGSRTSVCNQKKVENFDDTSDCYETKNEVSSRRIKESEDTRRG